MKRPCLYANHRQVRARRINKEMDIFCLNCDPPIRVVLREGDYISKGNKLSNSIDQTCIQHNMTSIFKQNQDCAPEIASSACELTISCNEECNLPRTPSTKDTNTEYNLSLSGTPSKRQLEDTQMLNIPNKIWRPARIGDLTPEHFSTPRRALRNIQLIQEKMSKQRK
ncbi:chloride channel protein 2-like protein [Lasius niger]|uniref:Chloride channel protein 2-like protein n=1 Tax=Lasius niger TaxID=67767 RepID=A0A0J7K6K9_LASNI|nr:chloride channel protein 2-like protein [Lasius niger]